MGKKLPRPKPGPLQHKKNSWKIHFSFNGKQYKRYAGIDEQKACLLQCRVNSLILDFKYGLVSPPENTSLCDFIFSQVIQKPNPEEIDIYKDYSVTHLSELVESYTENELCPKISSKAPNSIKTEKTHLNDVVNNVRS